MTIKDVISLIEEKEEKSYEQEFYLEKKFEETGEVGYHNLALEYARDYALYVSLKMEIWLRP